MSILPTLEAYYKNKTYSSKNGYKRDPQKVSPSFNYAINGELLTDRQIEFYLIQHKNMVEFLDKEGLLDKYSDFQKKDIRRMGNELVEWFKKWH